MKIKHPHKLPRQQRGVAIITALLIVAIAVTISVTISTRLQLDIRRTGNMIMLDQARLYVLAAEKWSQRILEEDRKDNAIDTLEENWAIALPPIPVEGGSIQGTLTDLSACLNINSLLDNKGAVDPVVEKRLSRLFANAGLKESPTQAIIDWLDKDLTTTNPNGAEDGYYLNLATPYRVANASMESLSELRLVKGFEDSKTFFKVRENLCAYSTIGGANSVNINTASKEVLKSLATKLTDQIADDIIEQRSNTPFENLKDFTQFNQLKTIVTDTSGISFSSENFLLRTQAVIGKANLVVYSILYRDANGNTTVVARSDRIF